MEHDQLYALLRTNYVDGYGAAPKKYFTKEDLDKFVKAGKITEADKLKIISEKK